MSILIAALLSIWAIIAAVMILVILMQRPKSEGLGAAFGGGMTENLFGAQTTNVLVKFTSYLATIFFAITFALSILYAHQSSPKSVLREELLKRESTTSGAPATTQSPAASPAASASFPAPTAAPSASVAASPAASVSASASPKKP